MGTIHIWRINSFVTCGISCFNFYLGLLKDFDEHFKNLRIAMIGR